MGENRVREEALKEKAAEEKKEEPQLPKLSAADYRVYNSMAEHMQYFVGATLAGKAAVEVKRVRVRANHHPA